MPPSLLGPLFLVLRWYPHLGRSERVDHSSICTGRVLRSSLMHSPNPNALTPRPHKPKKPAGKFKVQGTNATASFPYAITATAATKPVTTWPHMHNANANANANAALHHAKVSRIIIHSALKYALANLMYTTCNETIHT